MKTKYSTDDLWNRLIKLRDLSQDPVVVTHTKILLSQLNTASGSDIMKHEIAQFLYNYENNKK